ncbi:MAG TPA: phosphotransferase [Firmicutes bacterium]|nr:phosphotransferase [Bacillota bacterium]
MGFYEMHTEEMQKYRYLDSANTLDLFYELDETSKKIAETKAIAEESFLYSQIKEIVENCYDIGKIEEIYEIFGGYVNRSFGLYTVKDGERQTWFFRKYMRHKDMNELMLEHKLLTYAKQQGFTRGAVPEPGKDGNTFYSLEQKMEDGSVETWYFAVYNFIEGRATYDWINNMMPQYTYESVAELLAELHNAVRDFDPETYERAESRCDGLMKEFPDVFRGYSKTYADNGYDNCYTQFFASKLDYIEEMCKKAYIPEEDLKQMPVCPLQCDFHPGNVKYDRNGYVTGIYDFDWAKMDIRLFEFGLGMVYFFASWDADNDGEIYLDRIVNFVNVYNKRLRELGGLAPIGELEKKYFYELLLMGNMYLVRWCSEAYYKDMELNPYEYFYYMRHQVKSIKWMEDNEAKIREVLATIE